MLFGSSLSLQRTFSADVAFTISAKSVLITWADASTSAPAVTDSAPGAAVSHTLSALASPPVAGPFTVRWSMTSGAQTIIEEDVYFATWTDAAGLARLRLSDAGARVNDAAFDTLAERAWSRLLTTYPCLVAYYSLAGADRRSVDEALAILSAYVLYPVVTPGGLAGNLSQMKQGPVEYRWMTPPGTTSIREAWPQEAAEALGRVTCIASLLKVAPEDIPIFVISGPSRHAGKLIRPSALTTVLSLLGDLEHVVAGLWPVW